MLTIKQNLLETMNGGKPDRFVNQYEFMEMIFEIPIQEPAMEPGMEMKSSWGVMFRWPKDQLGEFPVHDDEHTVLKDVTKWKEVLKAPSTVAPEADWAAAVEHAKQVDRNEKYVTAFVAPGVFEMTHYLMGMENALMSFYEEPEAMQEVIDYITEWEIQSAKEIIDHIHPDAIFHHDDWGGQISTFLSPAMFEEFLLPAYKKIYGFYKANGVELIVHHSDSYAATLVPYMIEMGIDIWQGVMTTNHTPELIEQYGKQITFMGDIDSGVVDTYDWSREKIYQEVEKACSRCGKLHFIPNLSQGMDISSFPGVYETTTEIIDELSRKMF